MSEKELLLDDNSSSCNCSENEASDERVIINVSGMTFETRESTLARFPRTLLGSPLKRLEFYDPQTNEYFFNRNRQTFESILYYYQSYGRLHKPTEVPMSIFRHEMEFFQLDEKVLHALMAKEGYLLPPERIVPKNEYQRRIWEMLEYPDTSITARIIAVLSLLIIITSIAFTMAETVPQIRDFRRMIKNGNNTNTRNKTDEKEESDYVYGSVWFIVELIFNSLFAIEYFVRFAASPDKWEFLKYSLNIIDLIAFGPFLVILAIDRDKGTSLAVVRVLRIVRVFRVFKLSRYSKSLKIVVYCIAESIRELGLLVISLFFLVLVTATALYNIELGMSASNFTSIPATCWFTMQTITTIGYGDLVPVSVLGKLVAAGCAIFGALTMALPVLTFVSNFNRIYCQNMEMDIEKIKQNLDRTSVKIQGINS